VTRAVEAVALLKTMGRGPTPLVDFTLDTWRNTCRRVGELAGMELTDKRILDVGPGQQLRHMRCFSLANDVTGIDLDPIPRGLGPRELAELIRSSPALRVAKTVARKALGVDRRFERSLARALGARGFGELRVLRMDACRMSFADASFDFVCSYSCFEHIPEPVAALREIARVLVPGGAAYISVHHYTSHSGAHDASLCGKTVPEPPYWPHLRPSFAAAVRPAAYVNRVRMGEWLRLFEEAMPGTRFVHERQQLLAQALPEIRAGGELRDYTDDELLTLNLVGIWRKPLSWGPHAPTATREDP
jgi:SAM-dependent methyltransferase